jgi:hypothetical protein
MSIFFRRSFYCFDENYCIPLQFKMRYTQAFHVLLLLIACVSPIKAQQVIHSDSNQLSSSQPVSSGAPSNLFSIDIEEGKFNKNQQHERMLQESSCYIDNFIQGFGYDNNIQETGNAYSPPNPSGAAGKNRLVVSVKNMVEVRTKNGTLIFRDSIADFFNAGNLSATNGTNFDPKVVYDEHNGRFVVVAIDSDNVNASSSSRVLLAVSKNELPDSGSAWNFLAISASFTINGRSTFVDYPGLEVDDKVVYITANLLTYGTPVALIGSRLWILDKGVANGFYGGASALIRGPYDPYQDGGAPRTTLPAQIHGASDMRGSIGTFLVAMEPFSTSVILNVFTVNNVLNNVAITRNTLNVGPISQSSSISNVPQLGTTSPLVVFNSRINDAVWRDNKLWVSATVTPSGSTRASSYWIRMDTTSGIITIEAQGTFAGDSFSPGTHTFSPAVDINQKGEVAFGYGASSPTMYAGAYGSLLLGATELPFVVQRGRDYFIRSEALGSGINYWGAYSSISVDPNDNSFWIFNQFADTRGSVNLTTGEDGRWGTAWARVYCNATVCIFLSSCNCRHTVLTVILSFVFVG